MFEFDVDREEELDLSGIAKDVSDFGENAEARLGRAVKSERASHRYQNRSTDAENSTRLSVVSDGENDLTLDAEMSVEYASYLQKNGWSEFESKVRKALGAIDDDAAALHHIRHRVK
ncbi:MAG: hypothetical protein HOW73_47560 [Polyangiaceae bacterium]|nr:hypothetical protein [Polyangiaceae bacterium]